MTTSERVEGSENTADAFAPCSRCSLTLRQSEMQIHLAHSHNIGPERKSDKDKKNRGTRAR